MTEREYQELQKRFKNKIVRYATNKEEAYNEGVRSCMSILHEVYEKQKRMEVEHDSKRSESQSGQNRTAL